MKRIVCICCVLLLVFLTVAAKNRGLLIGVGNYPQHSGWSPISSTNDVNLLKKTLGHSFSIMTLIDNEATYAGIIKAITNLTSEAQSGDTILIHFSCHGQQVLTTDKEEPDALDEALVPFDALSVKSETYSGENHLLDNKLGELIAQLRKIVGKGGLVVITLDACFSDSMNKGGTSDVIYRGGADIFGSNTISKDSLMKIEKKMKTPDLQSIELMPDGADVVILSACQSYQKNMEITHNGVGYGSLSYAMFLSFKDKGFENIHDWLNEVISKMSDIAFTQTPQVRTTLDWKIPHEGEKASTLHNDNDNHQKFYTIKNIAFGLLFIFILAGVVIWKRKK